jgi:catechol 2,3-dioxygenase-like lactoylglutathione lyase family enzyme
MALRIQSTAIDARDPAAQGRFWAEVLGWRITEDEPDEVALEPPAGSPEDGIVPDLLFLAVPEGKTVKNRLHLDLRPEDQAVEVAPSVDRRGAGGGVSRR